MKVLIAIVATCFAFPLKGDIPTKPHKHCPIGSVATKYAEEKGHKGRVRAVYVTTFCKNGKRISRWA